MGLQEQLEQFITGWTNAATEPFTNHPLGKLFRQSIKAEIDTLVKGFNSSYEVKASVGAGNWANVPWISILNPKITTTTQDGIYPVYLFKADGTGFYLSLIQGATTPKNELGKVAAESRADQIKSMLLKQIPHLAAWGVEHIELNASTELGRSYEKFNISAKYYDAKAIPNNDVLKRDLYELLGLYQQIETARITAETSPNLLEASQPNNIRLLNLLHLPKPFLLLAGISGTGKTRFVREQAKASGDLSATYCLTSVRPDWHEPSDLLGYHSRLSGKTDYVVTDVLQFIAKAWRALVDAGLSLSTEPLGGQGERLLVSGDKTQLQAVPPYWLCLDEMNLAPVEQYFADYLSVLETRHWHWQNDSFRYCCDPLLKASSIQQLTDSNQLRFDLGLANDNYDQLWSCFCQYGISIPFNLMVAGTVNMDETTHSFSRKVIDRALSFDFGEFFPNNFADYFAPSNRNKEFSYPLWSHVCLADLATTYDTDGQNSIGFLTEVNAVLTNTPFQLAYRALNELLLAVLSAQPQTELELKAVWDDFLMCKVLPRIEGDSDKLATTNTKQSLLTLLLSLLESQFAEFWQQPMRSDLFRESTDGQPLRIACRSKTKIQWMQQRLENSGFTSFWP